MATTPGIRTAGNLSVVQNIARIHQTLRVTRAMEAGVANHVWSIEEIVVLLS